jgi:PilZ domain
MDRRREKRVRRRIPCDLWVEGRHHHAVVLNLASRGLFVQTRAKPSPGTAVEVRMRTSARAEPIVLSACVARLFLVPSELAVAAGGGVGLRIRSAPNTYFSLLADAAPRGWFPLSKALRRDTTAEPESPMEQSRTATASDRQARRFRVRVCETDGSRPFTLLIVCSSEAEASEEVLAELGAGWKVVELKEV